MRTLLVFSCLLLACATAEPIATPAPPPAPTRLEASPRQAPPFDARSFAANQLTPLECEKGARQLYEIRPDQGWAALVACVDRTRWPRGEFTHLELLTRGVWDQELQTRPEAPRLIAKVVALRGGDVEGDIPLVQKSRVPLFTLAAALRQPDVYKGRWVLVRGALSGIRSDYKASGSGQYSSSGRTEYSSVKQKFENERVETGRRAVGKLPQADPFLEPEKDFLFLARFDGVNPGQDQHPVAMLSIAGYFQPNALLIQ